VSGPRHQCPASRASCPRTQRGGVRGRPADRGVPADAAGHRTSPGSDGCSNLVGLRCQGVEKARIEVRLANLDARVFSPRANAPYDPNRPWLDNALAEHQRLKFRAIVAEGGTGADVIDAAALDDRCDLWRVDAGCLVPREAAEYVRVLELLLCASSKIIYVTPFFRADQPDKTAPIVAVCSALAASATCIEVHFGEEPRSYAICMTDADRYLPRILPLGSKVTLRCWKERDGGTRLHNRYLLTDIGGVQFGDEIEVGAQGHEDRLSILDEPSRAKLWAQYTGDPAAFDSSGPLRHFVGTRK
jgi:hypothetical protein